MKPSHIFSFLLLLTVFAACRPEPTALEPEHAPAAKTICFARTEYVDRGPTMANGDYDVGGADYRYALPACHPASSDTMVYYMTYYDGDFSSLRYEIWWYNLRDESGAMIYRGKPVWNLDLSLGGWVAFSSARGVAVVRLDGSGLTYLQDGTWKPQWYPLGDTLFLEEAVAYQLDGQWIKKPYAETRFEPGLVPSSPNGKQAFRFEGGGLRRLFLVELSSFNEKEVLLPNGIEPGLAIWSEDMTYLYASGRDTNLNPIYSSILFRVNLQTFDVDVFREFDGTNTYRHLDITADGQHVITSRILTDSVGDGVWYQRPEIWIMDADGCNERKLDLPME